MHALILAVELVTLTLGGAALILAAERRVATLPRPGDAMVTAVFAMADYPDEGITTVAIAIANPADTPVLAGLSPRGRGWPGRGTRTTIPCRTTRRRYRADQQATVGVVPPQSVSRLSVLIAVGRRCRIVIVVGQSDGRLRVTSVPVAGKPTAAQTTMETFTAPTRSAARRSASCMSAGSACRTR